MDDRFDLDVAAQITWRDEADAWPWQPKTSRSDVHVPDSIGIELRKGDQEGSVVLFRGGWADLVYWDGASDEVVNEAPGWEDWLTIDTFVDLLDRFGRFFTKGR